MSVSFEMILNSKFFGELAPEQLGEKMIDFGYDGIDVCIRPGHPVNFDNMTEALPRAVKVWEGQGLVCPMASAPVDFSPIHTPTRQINSTALAALPACRLSKSDTGNILKATTTGRP